MLFKLSMPWWQTIKNGLAWVGATAIVLFIAWVVCVHFATRLLMVNVPLAKADWIVVLGGESGARIIRAAELYHAGIAPKVFVTGGGDCLTNVAGLEMAGVPAINIAYECSSKSTYENALFTQRALSGFNPQKLVLVTSWFHTRRALWVYQRVWPSIQIGIVGVIPGGTTYYWLPFHESGWIVTEYAKYLWYRTTCTVWNC